MKKEKMIKSVLMLTFFLIILAVRPAYSQPTIPNDTSSYDLTTPYMTRFGVLSIDGNNSLLLNGLHFSPDIQGNSALSLDAVLEAGDHDIAIVEDDGGAACPTLFYIADISATGSVSRGVFGSCGSLEFVHQKGDAVYIVEHDYRGPFEPQADQESAQKRLLIYKYENENVTMNGSPVTFQNSP